ncbi:MAG: hypothetical protein HYX87_03485 [Chloroflexi bacterium]|nr:hypothetical protein [Chloroflexota bacterium]
MPARQNHHVGPPQSPRKVTAGLKRTISAFGTYFARDGLLAILLLGTLLAMAWSLEQANWVETPSLLLVTAVALLGGIILSRVRVHAVLLYPVGILVGLITVLLLLSALPIASPASGVSEILYRLAIWFRALAGGGMNADRLPSAFLLTFLVWLISYVCTWLVLRHRSYWGAVIIVGTALVVNIGIVEHPRTVEPVLFLTSAMLLRARMHSLKHDPQWNRTGRVSGSRAAWSTFRDGFVLAAAAVAIAFALPAGKDLRSLDGMYRIMHSPVERLSDDLDRLFAGLSARVPGSYRVFGEQMALGGTVVLSDTPSLVVQSPFPVYLRARVYDVYASSGWRTGPTEDHDQKWFTENPSQKSNKEGPPVAITVKPEFPSDVLFVAGNIINIDHPSNYEIFASPSYTLNLNNKLQNSTLPDSMKSIARELQTYASSRTATRQSGNRLTKEDLQRLLPFDIVLLDLVLDRGTPSQALVARKDAGPPDLVSVQVTGAPSSDQYNLLVSFPPSGPDVLRAAGDKYPGWVVDRYLQLPSMLPQRVRDLAVEITRVVSTPYDKAVAIETYLRKNIPYSLMIDPPPYNRDAVDYFLFDARKGYCDYFASAMAVMLRATGVPARVASGYAPGEQTKDGTFLVRDRNAHSWPQVYFPGHGWVEFEPTPSQPLRPITSGEQQDDQSSPDAVGGQETTEDEQLGLNLSKELPFGGGTGGGGLFAGALWLLLPTGLVLSLFCAWRWMVSRPASPQAAYQRLYLAGLLVGIPAKATETPYEYARSLGAVWPEVKDQVWEIIDTYVRYSYGGPNAVHVDGSRIRSTWREVTSMLLKRLLWRV